MDLVRLLPLMVVLATSLAALPDWYGPFRSHSRVLLVFASSEADPSLAAQRAALRPGSAGNMERDLVLIEVVGKHAADARVDGGTLREAYGAAMDAFTVILIGKDGGEKLRRRHPITEAALFAAIDAMPMRQDEMSRRSETQ